MNINTRDMILVSFFAALTAIGSIISIPLHPVPMTLQLFFCLLSGIILGARRGMMSQLLYVIMGLCGLPVFSGGTGGIASIVSPSFGYLLGFIAASYVIGKLLENAHRINTFNAVGTAIIGIFIVYIIGTAYMYLIMNFYLNKHMTVWASIAAGVLPFIVKDIAEGVIAAIAAVRILPVLRKISVIQKQV